MATPILRDLRRFFPNAEIAALCKEGSASLLKEERAIDTLLSFSHPKEAVAKMQKKRYDLGILLTNSFSSAWHFWCGRVKERLGYSSDWRRLFLTHPLPFPKERESQHLVLTYKQLLTPLGIPLSETAPQLTISKEEEEWARAYVKQLDISDDALLIGVNSGAAYGSAKCWPLPSFREVAEALLAADPRYHLLFFGERSHHKEVEEICLPLPQARVFNLAGKTHLRELLALIKRCALFLTNDSGPMHIADSLGVPLLALFGSTNPIKTGPYNQKEHVLYKGVSCSPCYRRSCPIDFRCMKQITPQEVTECLLQRLRGA